MTQGFRLDEYDYGLPQGLIAQHPLEQRNCSRLMVLERSSRALRHCAFHDLPRFLDAGDCLVLNNSRVFPARLTGVKTDTGGRVEIFLLSLPRETAGGRAEAEALVRASKPLRPGQAVECSSGLEVTVLEAGEEGRARVELACRGEILEAINACGQVPLPPYIRRPPSTSDQERYQTVYAGPPGSVAAPTAGLHFTEDQLRNLEGRGVRLAWVTLHVGYGTFAPIRCPDIREHRIHAEWACLPEAVVQAVSETRRRGGRIIAVGTTSCRVLEAAAAGMGGVRPFEGPCDLYILPGHRFRVVDGLLTNFHLPRSSLLVLVAAFAGRETILSAYRQAVAARYRFYSYGDAMLIL